MAESKQIAADWERLLLRKEAEKLRRKAYNLPLESEPAGVMDVKIDSRWMRRLKARVRARAQREEERQRWWDSNARVTVTKEPDGQLSIFIYVPGYLRRYRTYQPVKSALKHLDWPSKRVKVMFGNVMPRDIRWFESRNRTYVFSNKRFEAQPWPYALRRLRVQLNDELNRRTHVLQRKYAPYFRPIRLNSVLANRYKGPRDSISAHSDNEPLFGRNPTIISLTLGSHRIFKLSPKTPATFDADRKWTRVKHPCTAPGPSTHNRHPNINISLGDGDLLIMAGAAQDWWEHRIDKATAKENVPDSAIRYNMTWRHVVQNPPAFLPRKCK